MYFYKNTLLFYFPVVIIGLVSTFHIPIIVLLSLALSTGSTGLTPAILLVISTVVLLVIGCCLLHRLLLPERNRLRNIITFTLLLVINIVCSTLVLIQARRRELHVDLATLANPHKAALVLVTLSCCATFFAFVGFCLSPFSRDPEPRKSSETEWGRHKIVHYSERLVTLPMRPDHNSDPTKSPNSCAASVRTLNVTTQTVRKHDGFETTYITWTDVPL